MTGVIDFQAYKDTKEIKEYDAAESFDSKLLETTAAFFGSEKLITEFALASAFDLMILLDDMGLDIESDPKVFLDLITLMESIKAIIARCRGHEYSWHGVSNKVGSFTDEEITQYYANFLKEMVDPD